MTITALLLCTGINGYGALRSLAAAGVRVAVLYHDPQNPVHWSRLPAKKHHVPRREGEAGVLTVIERYGSAGVVVIPCSDGFAELLSRHREQLLGAGLKLAIPPDDVTEALNDKAREIALVAGHDVTLPKSLTSLPPGAAELIAQLPLPIIVKPRSYRFARLIPTKNVILRDRAHAEAFLAGQQAHLDAFVAQEIIPGPDESLWVCNCCFDANSELVSAFTFQRIRTSPAHFGVTSFGVGRDNPAIKATCADIGRALRYRGPAMMEFKHHAVRNVYCYIETNPRLGMCNILDTRSGVNNVLAAYRVARGEPPPARLTQTDGVYFLNAYGDIYSRVDDGERLRDILASYWRIRSAPIAWSSFERSDPLPFVMTMRNTLGGLQRAVGRRFGRLRGR